ncbi:MAG: hypothetical protein ABJA60_03175 [Nitrosospira sp.]
METFDIDHSLVGAGRVFPSHIEQMDWTVYHETSSYYSARIESDGFLMEKPIPVADIDFVIDLTHKLGFG